MVQLFDSTWDAKAGCDQPGVVGAWIAAQLEAQRCQSDVARSDAWFSSGSPGLPAFRQVPNNCAVFQQYLE